MLLVLLLEGVVYDFAESSLIFELNSQTNAPLSSVFLQTRGTNASLVCPVYEYEL